MAADEMKTAEIAEAEAEAAAVTAAASTGKIEKAVQWMLKIANDNKYGYSETDRWGPNYDCSSFVISAWQQAGVPVKSKGATTTHDMKAVFLKCGFSNVFSKVDVATQKGLQRGDVLLNEETHAATYIGSGKIVAAAGTKGHPESGDQTGKEVTVEGYYNCPWNCVLRYTAKDGGSSSGGSGSGSGSGSGTTKPGNAYIRLGQNYAKAFAHTSLNITGVRDAATKKAGIMVLQTALNKDYKAGLKVDGVWSTSTKNALGNHYVSYGESQYMVTAAEILLLLRGYNAGGVENPGTFGDGLLAAVKKFQKDQKLTVDGVCGKNCFTKLVG